MMSGESSYILRLLDPLTDQPLFAAAYNWRSAPKRHTQPDRLPFAVFADNNPAHLAIGLFNGELQAVYFMIEVEPSIYEAHFTSQRNVSREVLLEGAQQVADAVLSNGGSEIHAWVTPRNKPLQSFLGALGFTATGSQIFPCQNDTDGASLSSDRNQRMFVKYSLQVDDHRIKRHQAEVNPEQPSPVRLADPA